LLLDDGWIASGLDNSEPLPRLNLSLLKGDRADFADGPSGWISGATEPPHKHEGLRPGVGHPNSEPKDQGVKDDPPLAQPRWFDGVDSFGGECTLRLVLSHPTRTTGGLQTADATRQRPEGMINLLASLEDLASGRLDASGCDVQR
jgi:hypothetical protein